MNCQSVHSSSYSYYILVGVNKCQICIFKDYFKRYWFTGCEFAGGIVLFEFGNVEVQMVAEMACMFFSPCSKAGTAPIVHEW